MAVIKAVASSGSIGAAIGYVTKKEKTDVKLLSGIDCSPEVARQEMQTTKEFWGKTEGRSYLSFVQSFHAEEKLSPKVAHEIGVKLAEKMSGEGKPWAGYEILIATHIDKGHFHTHFIVNSVSMEDGRKIQFSKSDLAAMKQWSDDLCREFGLTITEKGKTFHGEERTVDQPTTYSKEANYIMEQAAAGNVDSYIKEIAKAVVEVRSAAISREDFCQQLEARGIAVNWSDTRKNITFTDVAREMHGERKCKVRDSNLEKTFPNLQCSKESFILAFEANAQQKALEAEQSVPELAAHEEPQQAAPEVGIHDAAPEAPVAQQPAEGRRKAMEEPEPERYRVYTPEPKTDSERLQKALSDLKAAAKKDTEARKNFSAANKLPFWDKSKDSKKNRYRQQIREAEQECAAAFEVIKDSGIILREAHGTNNITASSCYGDNLVVIAERVESKVEELQRKEVQQIQKSAKHLTMDEAKEDIAAMREKQKQAEPEIIVRFGKTKSKGHEDR